MEPQTHTVLRGDNLSIISKEYSVDINDLAKENGIEKNSILSIDQKLKIPEKRVRVTSDAVPNTDGICSGKICTKDDFFSSAPINDLIAFGARIVPNLYDDLLSSLRAIAANERMIKSDKVSVTKNDKPANYDTKVAKKKGSKGTSKFEVVKNDMREKLGKQVKEVTVNGVKLTQNEKRRIVASVALCEMNGDGYGSINADQEFAGGMGDGISYAHVVHIGLSYGLIQYAQDLGPLGTLLSKMYEKDSAKFVEIFGGGDAAIAQNLITLTTTGHPNFVGKEGSPDSGFAYWQKIKKTDLGKKLKKDSKEIRGVRVHPLVPKQGEPAIDIWKGVWKERFLEAGKVAVFQEVQLDVAVEKYMDKILPDAKEMKIRSALSLAFLTACRVRGVDIELLNDVADELGVHNSPFSTSADERKCIEEIAKATITSDKKDAKIGGFKFKADEARRAKILVKDDLQFLAEDHYDPSTY